MRDCHEVAAGTKQAWLVLDGAGGLQQTSSLLRIVPPFAPDQPTGSLYPKDGLKLEADCLDLLSRLVWLMEVSRGEPLGAPFGLGIAVLTRSEILLDYGPEDGVAEPTGSQPVKQ